MVKSVCLLTGDICLWLNQGAYYLGILFMVKSGWLLPGDICLWLNQGAYYLGIFVYGYIRVLTTWGYLFMVKSGWLLPGIFVYG